MKKLMLGTAMAVVLGGPALAQDLFRTEMDPVAITASDFIGKRVYAAEAAIDADEIAGVQEGWADIGEINDVVLTRDGTVDAVLVDIGGFLGIGERQVALGMENIRFVSDSATAEDLSDFFLVINADRTILEGAPEYMRTGAAPMEGTTETAETAPTNIPAVDEATGAAEGGADVATTEPMTEGTTEPMADGSMDTATTDPVVEGEADVATTDPAMDGTATRMVDGFAAIDPTSITSTDLVGVRVYGPNDEDVGEISEIVMDDAGAAAQVIVDVGGFLGIGEKPVAIDMPALQLMQAEGGNELRAYVSMTQEELETLPAVQM